MSKEKNIQSRSIKLYDDEWEDFKKIKDEMDGDNITDRTVFLKMMDFYKNPKTIKVTDPEILKQLEELKKRNEELVNDLNEASMKAQSLQLELDRIKEGEASRPENVFTVEVHPVAFHFLKAMSEKTKKTPGDVLVNLFLCDLQNPRANNLPYIVPSSEVRAKLEQYKKEHPEEYQGKEA